jgi:hypothetical protein
VFFFCGAEGSVRLRCAGESLRYFALKQCKAEQSTEKRVVSPTRRALFHKLINTCVENFTEQKYSSKSSARLVLSFRLKVFKRACIGGAAAMKQEPQLLCRAKSE